MQLQKIFSFALFLFFPVQLFCMHPDDAIKLNPTIKKAVEQIKEDYKISYYQNDQLIHEETLQNPDSATVKLVQQALEQCKIKESIIVLQHPDPRGCLDFDQKYNQYFMIVPNDTMNIKEGVVYHELGHYVHNDIKNNNLKAAGSLLCTASGTVLGMQQGYLASKNSRFAYRLAMAGITSIPVFIISKIAGDALFAALLRSTEHKADKFMYKKLIEQRKWGALLEHINFYLGSQDSNDKKNQRNSIWGSIFDRPLFYSHPTGYIRAKLGLDALKANNISVKSIVENPNNNIDVDTKNAFHGHLKKWFPKELK